MTTTHDLIVLGAGSGGLATAFRAARHGARVALLDPAALGGTCVHRGCVPKKALWFAAQWAQAQHLAKAVGFASQPGPLDWERFNEVRAGYIDDIDRRYAQRLQQAGVELIRQAGRFASADTVELGDGRRLQAAQIVIATGARPRTLELPGFELGMLSDDVFALRAPPRRVTIVGGGYVAVEFAGLLQALGSQVEVLAHERLLEGFDEELVDALERHMRQQGIGIHLHSEVRAAHRDAGGIRLDDASASREPVDAVLWAVGRVPCTATLGLAAVGVDTDERGHVKVDARRRHHPEGADAGGCRRRATTG